MLKPLYHNFFVSGSGGRIAYESSRFVPTKDGYKQISVTLSDFRPRSEVVPFTNFDASVLITAGKKLDVVPSAIVGIDADDVERIEFEMSNQDKN